MKRLQTNLLTFSYRATPRRSLYCSCTLRTDVEHNSPRGPNAACTYQRTERVCASSSLGNNPFAKLARAVVHPLSLDQALRALRRYVVLGYQS